MQKVPLIFWRNQQIVRKTKNFLDTTTKKGERGACGGPPGENPVIVNARNADLIIGPIGIVMADSLMGEITAAMATAVSSSSAYKILIPVNRCNHFIAGCQGGSLSDYVATGSEEPQTATIVKALKAETLGILKSNNEGADNDMKIEDIDKDKLTDEEKKQLEAIVNKAGITKPEDDDNGKDDNKGDKDVKKIKDEPINHDPEDIYKGLHPAVAAELKSLRKARDESEERELTAIAKKYEVIGKKSEELVPTLKSLKAAGGTAYQDMIGVLDMAVEAVEKSGAFTEIGKSGHSDVSGSTAIAKARAIADEIKKSNPTMSDTEAMAKTWETHPELMEDYDNEIGG